MGIPVLETRSGDDALLLVTHISAYEVHSRTAGMSVRTYIHAYMGAWLRDPQPRHNELSHCNVSQEARLHKGQIDVQRYQIM
jgi:hypothetical protein